ncbi:CBS domain-containing protein [Rapidithrix thailandica]|uniref:CBS domain-containing protein n=1 Tax=Rapidithrix thailandica TaxID=413964 RepID=A0AAW9RUH8_9BACT
MTAEELINDLIPDVSKQDTIQRIMDLMDDFSVNQLPVVENGKYIGIITESNLLNHLISDEGYAQSLPLIHQEVYVYNDQHLYEVLNVATENDIELLPVLNREGKYLGVVSLRDTAKALARSFASQHPGGIFILLVDSIDYSLQEISRLIEANNAKVLSCFVENDPNNFEKLKVTIKVNTLDLTHLLATFERFNYQIIGKFHDYETRTNSTERLGILLKYLDM